MDKGVTKNNGGELKENRGNMICMQGLSLDYAILLFTRALETLNEILLTLFLQSWWNGIWTRWLVFLQSQSALEGWMMKICWFSLVVSRNWKKRTGGNTLSCGWFDSDIEHCCESVNDFVSSLSTSLGSVLLSLSNLESTNTEGIEPKLFKAHMKNFSNEYEKFVKCKIVRLEILCLRIGYGDERTFTHRS